MVQTVPSGPSTDPDSMMSSDSLRAACLRASESSDALKVIVLSFVVKVYSGMEGTFCAAEVEKLHIHLRASFNRTVGDPCV